MDEKFTLEEFTIILKHELVLNGGDGKITKIKVDDPIICKQTFFHGQCPATPYIVNELFYKLKDFVMGECGQGRK